MNESRPSGAHRRSDTYEFDVVLSFASEDRTTVDLFAKLLHEKGARPYDYRWEDEQAKSWGKDLESHLREIYSEKAPYCICFFSKAYVQKAWTLAELQIAQRRALQENREYILPVQLDDTVVPGFPPGIDFKDIRKTSLQELVEFTMQKLADRSGTVITRKDWSHIQKVLAEQLAGEIGEIAELRGYISGLHRANIDAGVKAIRNGVSVNDAMILDRASNLDRYVEILQSFHQTCMDQTRKKREPSKEDVEEAFAQTINSFWFTHCRWHWIRLILVATLTSFIAGLGLGAAVMTLVNGAR